MNRADARLWVMATFFAALVACSSGGIPTPPGASASSPSMGSYSMGSSAGGTLSGKTVCAPLASGGLAPANLCSTSGAVSSSGAASSSGVASSSSPPVASSVGAPPSPPAAVGASAPSSGGILPAHATGDHASGGITIENIPQQYGSLIQAAVTKYNQQYGSNLTVALVEAIIFQESKGDPNAQSQDGQDSEGLMQVSTAAPTYDIGDLLSPGGDQYDPSVSIDSGVHLLAIMNQCGTVDGPITHNLYSAFPGACGDLLLLAAKYQGGPHTTAVNTYSNQISTWMQSFSQGTQPTNNGAFPIGGKA